MEDVPSTEQRRDMARREPSELHDKLLDIDWMGLLPDKMAPEEVERLRALYPPVRAVDDPATYEYVAP